MKQITLDEDDWLLLLQALGIVMNVALGQRDNILAAAMLHLANAVNKNNPDWTPYDESAFQQAASEQRRKEAAASL